MTNNSLVDRNYKYQQLFPTEEQAPKIALSSASGCRASENFDISSINLKKIQMCQ